MRRIAFIVVCVLGVGMAQGVQAQEITLLYFNDAHEFDMVSTVKGKRGGIARMKRVVDSVRAQHPHSILLFGGDLAGGTLAGKLFRGSVMVEALNALGVDYANFGQHDFDYGIHNAEELVRLSSFTWITSNVVTLAGEPIVGSVPYGVHTTPEGVRVGCIGLTDKMNTTHPLAGVVQRSLWQSAKNTIATMPAVDYLIALTQMAPDLNRQLLDSCPQIHAIFTEEVSHHTSEIIYHRGRPIIMGSGNMGHLDLLQLAPNTPPRYQSVVIDSLVSPDSALQHRVDSLQSLVVSRLHTPVGTIAPEYTQAKCGAARLIAQCYREFYGTHCALMHGGGVRAVLPSDTVLLRHLYAMLPFENRVVPVQLTGRQWLAFFQRVCAIDSATVLATPEGSGTLSTLLSSLSWQPEAYYTVALPDFMVLGGAFSPIPSAAWLRSLEECTVDAEVVRKQLMRREGRLP